MSCWDHIWQVFRENTYHLLGEFWHSNNGLNEKAIHSFANHLCCCSVTLLCLTLCNPIDCSTSGLPGPSPSPEGYQGSCPLHQWCCLILWCPLLPSIFPSIRDFSNESAVRISSVQSLSLIRFFATPWTAARQASLSITNSQSLLKLMSIKSVMPSNHLILCRPFLLLPLILPTFRVLSNESVICIRWPSIGASVSALPIKNSSALQFFQWIFKTDFL